MVVPNMSDGRAFTDYRQNCQMMADFRKDVGIHDPKNVRLMMQQQAEQIIESNANGSNNCGRAEANGKTAMCQFRGDSLTATEFAMPVSLTEKDPHFTPAPVNYGAEQQKQVPNPRQPSRPRQTAAASTPTPAAVSTTPGFTPPTATFLPTSSPQ